MLDAWEFTTLAVVRAARKTGRHGYKTERSQESLGKVPPLIFLSRPTNAPPSNSKLCA